MGESVKLMSKDEQAMYRPLAMNVVTASRWFVEFPKEAIERLIGAGRVEKLSRGDILSRRGEPVKDLTIILDGSFDVSVTSPEGKRLIQVMLESGQIMNLIPVLDEQPSIHDVKAHTDAVVLQIHREDFVGESDKDPRVSRALMRILCLRSRVLYASLVETAFLPLRVRCARMLHLLMSRYGIKRGDSIEISLKLSQEDLADMIGRTRQSVNKELKVLERQGVLRMAYSCFIIIDVKALTTIALSEGEVDLPDRF